MEINTFILKMDEFPLRNRATDVQSTNRPNQAVQRTAGRYAFQFGVATNLREQPRALSPAVADLVSR